MRSFAALPCFCLLFFLSGILCGADLQFSGKPSEGDAFAFHYLSRDAIRYEINMKEIKPPPSRMETQRIKLSGTVVFVRKTSGRTVVEFRILGYSRENNGVRTDTKRWSGRKINIITGADGKTVCHAAASASRNSPKGISAPAMPEAADDEEKIPDELNALLISLFGTSAALPPAVLLGKDGPRKPGEKWDVNTKQICQELKLFHVDSRPEQWHAKAEYTGPQTIGGRNVNIVTLNILSDHILGFDCKIDCMYRFSAENPSKGPLFMLRKIAFAADRAISEGDPMFAGNLFTVLREHDTEIHMIPQDR